MARRHLVRRGLGRRGDRSVERLFDALQAELTNLQNRGRAFIVAKKHYDLGNDLFERMLGTTMAYSCGYWKEAATLDEALRAKHDLVARKLGLAPGMKVLDIGCGWGSFAEHAARHHDCEVVGITVSEEQVAYARERCGGLPVEIRLEDYRNLPGRFDRVISIGMFEHVGPRNYATYFRVVQRLLSCAGAFRVREIQLWQVVFSQRRPGRYDAPR